MELLAPLQPAGTVTVTTIPMDGPEMAKYAGTYTNPPDRVDLTIREGKLYFHHGTQDADVTKIGDLRFSITPAGAGIAQTFALVPGPDGTIAFLHMGSRAFRRPPRAL